MRPHDEWASLDTAEDVRRREAGRQDFDGGMLARLAESFERMDQEPPRSKPYWPVGVVVFLTALGLAIVFADATYPEPYTGPGWEAVCKGRC